MFEEESMKKVLFKIFVGLVTLNAFLLGDTVSNVTTTQTVEVSLDSFSSLGMVLMIVLTSFLGAYFIKDEFSSTLK